VRWWAVVSVLMYVGIGIFDDIAGLMALVLEEPEEERQHGGDSEGGGQTRCDLPGCCRAIRQS
jgi:hypothetical protein